MVSLLYCLYAYRQSNSTTVLMSTWLYTLQLLLVLMLLLWLQILVVPLGHLDPGPYVSQKWLNNSQVSGYHVDNLQVEKFK